MLTVIKRSGREEPFDREKIYKCLAVTSDEAGLPLTEGDLQQIICEVESVLQGREKVYHYQISAVVAGVLYTWGFVKLAGAYRGFVDAIA